MLSHVRLGTERSTAIYEELAELAQNPEIHETLAARAYVSRHNLEKIDEAFKLIGETLVSLTGRLHDVSVEDVHREVAEIRFQRRGVSSREGCGRRILSKDGGPDYRKHFCGSTCLKIDKRERLQAKRLRLVNRRCSHCGRKPTPAVLVAVSSEACYQKSN